MRAHHQIADWLVTPVHHRVCPLGPRGKVRHGTLWELVLARGGAKRRCAAENDEELLSAVMEVVVKAGGARKQFPNGSGEGSALFTHKAASADSIRHLGELRLPDVVT